MKFIKFIRSRWIILIGLLFLSAGCVEEKIINKPEDKPKVAKIELFVMSQCPFATQVENVLGMLTEQLKQKIEVSLYFIANEDNNGNISSLHGQPEVEEDIRQLIISRFYPDKFWRYLNSRNTDYRSPEWKAHTYIAGIDVEELQKLVDTGGKDMLKENIKHAQELKVTASPTIYIDGERYEGNRSFPYLFWALAKKLGDKAVLDKLPVCFSDMDCITPISIGICNNPATLKAQCENLDVSLKVVDIKQDVFSSDRTYNIIRHELPSIQGGFIDYRSDEGKGIVQSSSNFVNVLPIYLISSSLSRIGHLNRMLTPNKVQYGDKEYIVLNNIGDEKRFYLKREYKPKRLELWTMSMCPFGMEAEERIVPIAKASGLDLHINYIVSSSPIENNQLIKLSSLHGMPELEEDIRQLCIEKYYPDKYFDYLLARNKDINNPSWANVVKEVMGEGAEARIVGCQYKEGLSLLQQDMASSLELGISNSPTILWENQVRFNGLEELKKSLELFKDIEITKKGSCGGNVK